MPTNGRGESPNPTRFHLNEKQKIGQNRRMLSEGTKRLRPDGTIDFTEFSSGKTQSEIEAENKTALDKLKEQAERARRDDLASLKRNADSAAAVLKNRYETEQDLLD